MQEPVYEQLTLFQEDSRASRFPWLESKKVGKTTVISGQRCEGLSPSLNHVGYSVRTYLESCELLLPTSYRTWSVLDMTSSCLILKQRVSVPRTTENELPLWPTVTARDYKDGTATSCKNVPVNGLLGRAVHFYSTPNARDWKNATAKEWDNPKNTRNLNRQIAKMHEQEKTVQARNGQLNPTWVEWLMGFPTGWTELKP